jgi:predicted GIY-YIG superfamily endonuclease
MFYTYILASRRNGTLYTGSCEDLRVRVEQHQAKHFSGFTAADPSAPLSLETKPPSH